MTSDDPETTVESVRRWLRAWGDEVGRADIAAGRRRFDADLVAFGTHADVVAGRDLVEAEQWSKIWPAIEDFAFQADDASVLLSDDASMAVVVTGWTSTGISADGLRFPRPGRATVVLRRGDSSAPDGWIGTHTHFSLLRGVAQTTHGQRTAIR